jgi:hypothetical protein
VVWRTSHVARCVANSVMLTIPYHKGGQIPFEESSVVVTALVSVMITYRQHHCLAGTSAS